MHRHIALLLGLGLVIISAACNSDSVVGNDSCPGGMVACGGACVAACSLCSDAPAMSLPALGALSVSQGTLSPAFSPDVTMYTVTVPWLTPDSLKVMANATDPCATLTINGMAAPGGTAAVALTAGVNMILVMVQVPNGATQSYSIAVMPSPSVYVKASNTGAGDKFGYSLSLSGDTLAVGVPNEASNATGIDGNQADNSAPASGAVYVFARTGTTWSQQAYIKSSNTGTGDNFGWSVSLSGDTLAVGAYLEASNATGINGNQADNSAQNSGAVYVFTRTGTTWSQQAYIKSSNAEAFDNFGISVSLSGDTLAVGDWAEDSNATGINGNQADNSAPASGAVYVFARTGTTWSQQAYIKASNTDAFDRFGISVSLSGDTLAVGAHFEASNATGIDGNQADNSAQNSGAVYVFTRTGTTWSQQAYIKASNTGTGGTSGRFGYSVSLSGDTLAVGALTEASNATGINGNQANNFAQNSGAVYVFTRTGTTWSQQAYIKASNTGTSDNFGWSVSLSGETLAVGAYLEASNATGIGGNQADNSAQNSGAVYVFTRTGTTWSQRAYVKASNTGTGDGFGNSVSLSGDTLAVGAPGEASNATGIGSNQANNSASGSGAVYVFQ